MSLWKDTEYIKAKAGARTIPVEVGEHYLQEGWGQKLMLLSDFISDHLVEAAEVLQIPSVSIAALLDLHCLSHLLFP